MTFPAFLFRWLLITLPVPVWLIAGVLVAGGIWGEVRHWEGRNIGTIKERTAWETRFAKIEREKAAEKRAAESRLDEMASKVAEAEKSRDSAREASRIANLRLFAELASETTPQTFTCEASNEKFTCPVCPSPYRMRVDPRVLRNLATSRGQD